jgi:hypothetical protein
MIPDGHGNAEGLKFCVRKLPKGFISWRWGSLNDCVGYVDTVINIREFWDASVFGSSKDIATLRAVSKAFGKESLQNRVSYLCELSGVFSDIMSWAKGCHCHGDERMQSRSNKDKVACQLMSCRAPELYLKIQDSVAKLQSLANEPSVLWGEFLGDALFGLQEAAATLTTRFAYLGDLPYSLVRARDRAVAAAVIEEYDTSGGDANPKHHRVTRRLLSPAGEFREDLEVSPGLRTREPGSRV